MDDDELALLHVGKTIADKYQLLRLLGAGGMGAVYEAEHVFTKRRVALKRMHRRVARSQQAADRFVRECQAPSAIGHPGIVQVLDGGTELDGSLYLVLELLDGVSMQDALDQGTLNVPAILQIAIELLEALDAAHKKGFIHRDIKPDNVFLANDGRGGVTVKLLDFGIASREGTEGDAKLTRTGSVLGTPQYMSPEQAQGARVDARSDLWSVGAMLYRALAGRAPYQGETYNALIVSIVTRPHEPLANSRPDLPASLLDVVERAMRKTPNERFSTAEQMYGALRAVKLDTTVRVDAPSRTLTRSAPPPARAHWFGKLAGAVALAAACALSALALRRSPAQDATAQLAAAPALRAVESGDRPAPPSAAFPEPAAEQPPAPSMAAAEPVAQEAPAASSPATATAKPSAAHPARGLTPEALAQALSQREPEFSSCLQEATVAQLMAGAAQIEPLRLDVELTVAPNGRVERAELQGRAPEGLSRCLRARLSETQFPPAEAPSTFRYPLLLRTNIISH